MGEQDQRVYHADFEREPGRIGYLIVERTASGLRRVDAPSDWLLEQAVATDSPNTLKSLAISVAQWWCWALESGVDPLATDAARFARFVSALQTIPQGLPLTSPIRGLPDDPRLRAGSTVRLRVIQVKQFYRWALLNGHVTALTGRSIGAFKAPKATQKRTAGRLTPHQVNVLLSADLHPRNRFAIELLYGTGLREGEAVGLQIGDWCLDPEVASIVRCPLPQFVGPHLHVVRRAGPKGALAKSRVPRPVPLTQRVMAAYRDYQAWAYDHLPGAVDSEFVLLSTAGPTKGQPLSLSGFNTMWADKVKSILDLETVTPHLLRHTYASELADAGVEALEIQQLLGHQSPTSTQIYTHALMSSMVNAVQRLAMWRTTTIGLSA